MTTTKPRDPALPPVGYTLPKLAADLLAHAEAHGWAARVSWTPDDYVGEPFAHVEVGRKLTAEEITEVEQSRSVRGERWYFRLTWHSRDCKPGKVRLFRAGLAQTPEHPGWHDAPSVKAIRAVIAGHPVEVAA